MAETSDYSPGEWSGHDFKAARKAYDAHAGRSYADATTSGKTTADVVPVSLSTNSESPLTIVCDVTGSMGEWPATIFSKLPYLDIEGKEYLGPTMEICFAAVGDAQKADRYPLQARPFSKGTDLGEQLKNLIVEGGGGGGGQETYEVAALYFARNVKTPRATKPILIFIGDEHCYDSVSKATAARFNIRIEGSLDTKDIFAELCQKYSVYLIRKSYPGMDESVHRQWTSFLGADHIAHLDDPGRVVDVIFGILAKEVGKVAYFKEEIEGRQEKAQVETVYKSLKTIHLASGAPAKAGKSVMKSLPKGSKTKKLIP